MRSSKGQMKIQQMAFMLVAIMIFFAMVAVIYFTVVFSKLQDSAEDLQEQEAKELARQMSGTPELAFSQRGSPQSSTVDFDKAYFLSKNNDFKRRYWNLDYLMIERIYPETPVGKENCNQVGNYPDCKELTLIDKTGGNYSGTMTAPVALAVWDENLRTIGGYRFELGRIHALAHETTN